MFDLAEYVPNSGAHCVLAVNDVRAWVAHKRGMLLDNQRLESPLTIRNALHAAGLKGPKTRFKVAAGVLSQVVANFPIPEHATWPELKSHLKRSDELWPL